MPGDQSKFGWSAGEERGGNSASFEGAQPTNPQRFYDVPWVFNLECPDWNLRCIRWAICLAGKIGF